MFDPNLSLLEFTLDEYSYDPNNSYLPEDFASFIQNLREDNSLTEYVTNKLTREQQVGLHPLYSTIEVDPYGSIRVEIYWDPEEQYLRIEENEQKLSETLDRPFLN